MMDTPFRLTFNKPSGRAFLEGMGGVRVAIEPRSVRLLPVPKVRPHPDAIAFAIGERGDRGGYEAVVQGNRSADLLRVLQRLSTPRQPFFLLRKAPDGWLSLEHFAQDRNPPKFEPHMRFWPAKEDETPRQRRARETKENPAAVIEKNPALAYSSHILAAHRVLRSYHNSRRIGRPPRDVIEAQAVMEDFSTLVTQVRPSLRLEEVVNLDQLRTAHEHLGALLASTKAEDEKTEERRPRGRPRKSDAAVSPAKTRRGRRRAADTEELSLNDNDVGGGEDRRPMADEPAMA